VLEGLGVADAFVSVAGDVQQRARHVSAGHAGWGAKYERQIFSMKADLVSGLATDEATARELLAYEP
jgi:hypothetical protein